ncbi:MAG TPA: hypothetical protein VF591_21920 [Pyrinomonadaceae bacterium]
MTTLKKFPPPYRYSSLSIKDLLDARDAYHWHLSHLSNVVATAIGRYRIREDDWYAKNPPGTPKDPAHKDPEGERTLYNSVVTDWSWPCVLVFVSEWLPMGAFAASPDQMVPRALFLPDGRVVPTCTIRVVESDAPPEQERRLSFPQSYIGGGYLVSTFEQGREQLGSVGCLVTDGKLVYALTNRHVAGEPGREVFADFGGERERIGVSDARQLGKLPFTKAYADWPGGYVQANADVGLVRLDDLSRWTTQVRGFGPLEAPLDLTTRSMTLDLIDCPVRARGGASGELAGRIVGLFYRYKSVGGSDYVADFLIAPRAETDRGTLHGDSGTLWFLEEPAADDCVTTGAGGEPRGGVRHRPFAVQWGGHAVVAQGGRRGRAHALALATNLSTVCRELDLDVLRDWNTGLPEYWGRVGHATIGELAVNAIPQANANLRALIGANLEYFPDLANAPDTLWKDADWADGGRNAGPDQPPKYRDYRENPNHFADMDKGLPHAVTFHVGGQSFQAPAGTTLLQLCAQPSNIDVGVWQQYYDATHDPSRGLLPFRVHQIYRAMVKFAEGGDRVRFVTAAGILAHYVGDACQPLHITYKYNGDPDHRVDMLVQNEQTHQWVLRHNQPRGNGVHSAFETDMINHALDNGLKELVRAKILGGGGAALPQVTSGGEAAAALVGLMRRVGQILPPDAIIDVYAPLQGDPPKKFTRVPAAVKREMWDALRAQTVEAMTEGCRYLAHLWHSAWQAGHGNANIADLSRIDPQRIRERKIDHDFIPSVTLDKIQQILNAPPA